MSHQDDDPLSDLEQAELEIQTIADELTDEQWCTVSYMAVEKGLEHYLDEGDLGPLTGALDAMERTVGQATGRYDGAKITDEEVAAESVAGHRALQDGMDEWREAIALLRQPATFEDEELWREALERAEVGNRLLVAVQVYVARLQEKLNTFKGW